MGACTFETTAIGKSPAEAYRTACEQATYESGHDSYNGTISTTSGFVMVPVSSRTRDAGRQRIVEEILENSRNAYGIDKWGPCGCIELGRTKGMKRGERTYLFFGWAAE